MNLYDAHCHLHEASYSMVVVNSTCPADWPEVLEAAKQNSHIIPAIGLHPWQVNDAPSDWQEIFLKHIDQAQAVGEIGLDQWIDAYDIEQQQAAFSWQLDQAAIRNLPVSIHCLKASEPLLRILKTQHSPARGIHLHAYSGSARQVPALSELGAYFSFHASQLNGNAKKVPAAIRVVPTDRLLIETDAPDTLKATDSYEDFLRSAYQQAAELRGVAVKTLAKQVTANFARYFLND